MTRYLLPVLAGFTLMIAVMGTLAAIGGILGMNDDNSGAVASCMKQGEPRSQCP